MMILFVTLSFLPYILFAYADFYTGNGNKLGPTHEFSPDLNPDWIQKQLKGLTQIWHGTHIKFKLRFQSSFKSRVPNKIFYCGTRDFLDLNPDSPFELCVPNTHKSFLFFDRYCKTRLGQNEKLCTKKGQVAHRGARTHDHKVKSLALYQLS
jgi:hypothetical protein